MSTHSADLLGLYDNGPSTQSAGLTLNLSSNNPFRNRAASPNSLTSPPHSPFDDPPPPPRPTSRNPFLDPSNQPPTGRVSSPDKMATKEQKPTSVDDLFGNLSFEDKARQGSDRPLNRPPGGPPRGENNPPRGRGAPPSSSHKPNRSQEDIQKARRLPSASVGMKDAPSPGKRPTERRPRRNSDSSMLEKPLTEEEKKARELKRKERERRHRDGKDKSRTGRKLDIIDQLDATSIYGTGLFHHDGPFDACNPHRNRKGSRRAPMQAFAKDSANNSIGGAGPLTQRPDHKQFMGQEPHEASAMFGAAGKERNGSKSEATFFDPKRAGELVDGEETLGLGSSTFLEGTPAAQAAIQRNQAETAQEVMEQGLGRKKSVVQRFRSIKRPARDYSNSGRVTSPDSYYTPKTSDMSAGGSGERNPFFSEFDKAEERISVKRSDSNQMSPVSPPLSGLERRTTDDGVVTESTDGSKPGSNGFLSRVRSLKGGKRQRPEPPTRDYSAPNPGMAI